MNPSEISGFGVKEDPNRFIDKVYKTPNTMGLTSWDKAELVTYKLKDVAQVWYEKWKDSRPVRVSPKSWILLSQLTLICPFLWN